jgi:D-alanine-D-alanine ligase
VLIAKAAGIEYHALIAEILSGAIRRYKERERERRESARIVVGGPAAAQSVPPPAAAPAQPNGNGSAAPSGAEPGPSSQLQS